MSQSTPYLFRTPRIPSSLCCVKEAHEVVELLEAHSFVPVSWKHFLCLGGMASTILQTKQHEDR